MGKYKAPSKIIGVQFSILSPDEIRKNSVVEVTSRDTYINNKPVIGGLFDPRMGVLEPGTICPTDGYTYIDTPGYFGHIEMARPVFFIQHLREIMKISRCVCFKCSKLLINKSQHLHVLDMPADKRWDYVSKLASNVKRCGEQTDDGCGCKQPNKIKLEEMASLYAIWDNNMDKQNVRGSAAAVEKISVKLTPEMVLKSFKRISDDDIHFMGFSPVWSRPEWFICQALPVPPPAVRPSVKHDAQQRSEDDLTHIFSNIIRTNKDLQDKIDNNASANVIDGLTRLLQYLVAMIVNNKTKGAAPLAQRSGRPYQCIMSRLNSKSGRIRGNLMGKRVDFSARSVITGDPNLSIRQLGVPMKIAMNLTKPVVVNEKTRDYLMKLVQNGPDVYPGAKILERKNGEHISLRYVDRTSLRLEYGDIVHRHMVDGDAVLFNRQPSLHRMSMMCHIVKVMRVGDTFRMNVADTKPYNADFDGDEMNMHMPQNVLAETELRHLAAIPYQIVSPSSNSPIIGIYQDSLLGSYQFTRPNISFSPRDAMNLLMMYANVDTKALREAGSRISNFDILSQIMKPITLKYNTKLYNDKDEDPTISNNVLEIRNGKWIRGQVEKSVFGSTTKGILHRIFNDFGFMACANFIDDLQNVITEYMKTCSFSVGISDLIANKTTMENIIEALNKQKIEVQSLIEKVHLGIFENNTANTNMVEFELQVNKLLNKATENTGSIGRNSLGKDNRFLQIVNSGSKGSLINISQMIAGLGQQNVDGKRIPYGFDSRTLPHFFKYDDSPKARGFVENSYISGLTAPELFFHAMGGRIGLIDTAVKTSATGYIQRRLIKGLEDIKVEYDMTVRNSKGKIVQFTYGEDGFDTTRVENQTVPLVGMTIEDIYLHYDIIGVNEATDKDTLAIYAKATVTRMKKQAKDAKMVCQKYIDKMIKYREEVVRSVFKYKSENQVKVPVAFQNIIANIQGQLHLNANSVVDITPLECFNLVDEYYQKLMRLEYAAPNSLFEMLYFFYLSPRDLLVNKRFHSKAITLLLETVILKYKQAIVHPGEMVGIVAGHSVGEPSTQMTLNSLVFEDEIIVRNSKKEIKKVQIGQFTEDQIKLSQKIDFMEDKDTTYAELRDYYEVPCATESGETVWRRIEAVTRHPVINEDGTNTMLKVTTKECREVTATKAKSFLQLIDGKIQGVNGKDLKVGDYLPVSRKPLDYAETHTLNLREMLPPSQYIYGSEVEKARQVVDESYWWKKYANKLFTLPYSRSDSAYAMIKGKKINEPNVQVSGLVYTKTGSMCNYEIPEEIELDYDFGYLVGAYAAEGRMTKYQVSIANNDQEYFEPIQRLCEKWRLTTKIHVHENKNREGRTSTDLRIYNTILCKILDGLVGKLRHKKSISPIIVFSNRECILGFLDAYVSGHGCINCKTRKSGLVQPVDIRICSVSRNMLIDIGVMLRNIDIDSSVNKLTKQPAYSITIRNKQSQKLASILNLSVPSKREKLKHLMGREFRYEHCESDLLLPNIVEGELVMESRNDRMMDLKFDQIVSIVEVPNSTPYAYDLTVEDTRNFDCYNGLNMRDTFHLSGVASKSNVTRGVPRLEELLRLTKNPKNPSLTIRMKLLEEQDQDRALAYANMIEYTKLIDVVKSIQISFDPHENASFIEEDRALIEQFYEFENLVKECAGNATQADSDAVNKKSKWIIRMEMDPETLLDKNITMDDIHYAIKNSTYGDAVDCVFSDYNEDKLVFRIRINNEDNKKKKVTVANTLDQSDEIYMLKNFQDSLLNNVVLRGVNKIDKVIPRKLQNTVVYEEGKYVRKDVWVLDTTGTNLLNVLGMDFIDNKRTYSNDVREIYNVLGIEAARQMLFNEITEVMEFADAYINYHHLSLLCDRMTMTKDMVPIFRSGILNDNIGPIAKATFEVHTEVLLDAARHADFDHMRGVSASVMCGQYGNYGTGSFSLVLDMNQMRNLSDAVASSEDDTDDIAKQFELKQNKEDICSKKDLEIRNNIVNIKKGETNETCDDDYNMGF